MRVLFFAIILGGTAFFGLGAAHAATSGSGLVSISATVPTIPPETAETRIIFKGLAYPGSQVILTRDGSLVASVPADPTAHFEITYVTDPGSYTFSISATDSEGRTSPAMQFSVTLTEGITLTVNGIFLGPSIAVEQPTYTLSDTVVVFGETVPSSQVTVYVGSETTRTYQTTADPNGLYARSFLASDVGAGTHEANAKAVSGDAQVSDVSKAVSFAVESDDVCSGKTRGDINCDGSVNLVDFSILLYYWNQTNPANSRADINSDSLVNIVDFSILLYYWTG